jgi:transposase-like protein
MQFANLQEAAKYFQNEDKCRDLLAKMRWPDGNIFCPKCGSAHAYKYANNLWYKCSQKECKARFTVKVGTIYEGSKLPLSKWFLALWILSAHKKGISSCQLARDLGIGQKAAWFVLHRLREQMRDKAPQMLDEIVEVDETYVGGRVGNMKKSKREKIRKGELKVTKEPVMGIVQRDGKAILKRIEDWRLGSFVYMVQKYVKPDAVIVSDAHPGYIGLNQTHSHHVSVNHSLDEFKIGMYHTNTVEGFFSSLKRSYIGIYHYMSPKHLSRYLDETSQRYNSRKIKDGERFIELLKQPQGRLKYKDLIAKK